MSLFIESIRFENFQAPLLYLHEERLNKTRKIHFGNCRYISLKDIHPPDGRLYKCRILYGNQIESIEWLAYEVQERKKIRLIFCDEIDYSFKYQNRRKIEELFDLRQDADDILIIKNGFVTDTSQANIVFFDGHNWLTPETPLLKGVQREFLLRQKVIKSCPIFYKEISLFNKFMLINAMLPFNESRALPICQIVFN